MDERKTKNIKKILSLLFCQLFDHIFNQCYTPETETGFSRSIQQILHLALVCHSWCPSRSTFAQFSLVRFTWKSVSFPRMLRSLISNIHSHTLTQLIQLFKRVVLISFGLRRDFTCSVPVEMYSSQRRQLVA